jgi:soluble lytic murein transglycosylase-like protein
MQISEELAVVCRRMEALSCGPVLPGAFDRLVAAAVRPSAAASTRLSPVTSRSEIDRLVRINSRKYGVDPSLIEAIIAKESGFDPNAKSIAGAKGLMQLMPATAATLGVADAYDMAQNVSAGTRYLRSLLDRFGSVELSIAAYNAGPDAVRKYGGIPPYRETRNYVRSVLAAYRRFQLGNLATNAGSQRLGSIGL